MEKVIDIICLGVEELQQQSNVKGIFFREVQSGYSGFFEAIAARRLKVLGLGTQDNLMTFEFLIAAADGQVGKFICVPALVDCLE